MSELTQTVHTTPAHIAAVFTEWDRRWRKEPERFMSDCQRLLKGQTPDDYGQCCAPYFLEILSEIETGTIA